MKLLLLTLTVISFIQTTNAQITLTRTDLPEPGKKYFEAFQNKNLGGITPGEDGANKSWDYSTLVTDGLDTSLFILPSDVSTIASFPGSNTAQKFRDGYEFYNFNDDYAAITALVQFGNNEYLKFALEGLSIFKFPTSITENNSFSNTSVSYYKTQNNSTTSFVNSDSLYYKLTFTQSLEVRGWGNLKTPFTEEEVIKTKAISNIRLNLSHRNKVTGVWTLSPITQQIVAGKYYFYAKGKGIPLMTVTYRDSTDQNLSNISWYTGEDLIQSINNLNFVDESSYVISPNPGVGMFNLHIPHLAVSKISVLDVLGMEVNNSYNLDSGILEIDAPNGLYNVNLYTNNGIVVKRVVIQK